MHFLFSGSIYSFSVGKKFFHMIKDSIAKEYARGLTLSNFPHRLQHSFSIFCGLLW